MPHNGRYFSEQNALEGLTQLDQTVNRVGEEPSLGKRPDLRSASGSPNSDRQMGADCLCQSLSEATQDQKILDSESEEGAVCSHSIPDALRAFPDHEDAPIDAVGLKTAITGHRLNYPTHAIGDILQARSSNVKKRRSLSIFDFEEDATPNALGQSKKAKFNQENVKRDGKPSTINAIFPETRGNHRRAESTSRYTQKVFGETNHTDDLYLPRI